MRPYAYRGMSGDYLLILVNGKRRHTTSLINNLSLVSSEAAAPSTLDLIPGDGFVGRIEILRDGAAAIWLRRHLGRDEHHPRQASRAA